MTAKKSRSSAISLGDYLTFLLPRFRSDREIPRWPPDVFALCASLLVKSGAYCKTLTNWPPREPLKKRPRAWAGTIKKLAAGWRATCVDQRKLPAPLHACWLVIVQNWRTPIPSVYRHTELCQAILQLLAAADEACEGVGDPRADIVNDDRFHYRADALLARDEDGSSLCEEIHASRARVLPKMHTPWNGLTIRSLSFYLALCSIEEVTPRWIAAPGYPEVESMNLLLVPWPFRVIPSQFEAVEPAGDEMRNMPSDRFGFFTFKQRNNIGVVEAVQELYKTALADMGQIDGVVLPELALSKSEHTELRQFVLDRGAFLVSGVGDASKPTEHGINRVFLDIPREEPLPQSKHHRWKLDAA